MKGTICWGFILALAAAGAGWGQTASTSKGTKTVPTKTEKPAAKKTVKQPMHPAREDSLRHAHMEQRRLRMEAHLQTSRELYLARLTPEDRARAEESERRREVHMRVQDSLNAAYLAAARERMRQRAEAGKVEADKAKAAKPTSVQSGKVPAKKK
jgi:hypothetical protein